MTTEREMDAAYQRWLDEQARHGDCSFGDCALGNALPDCPVQMKLECYACSHYREPYVTQWVAKSGPVVNRADPTQTYVLACGHTTI